MKKFAAICMMILAFSLASCGVGRTIRDIVDTVDEIADAINEGMAIVVQEVTGIAIDEMGGGPIINLASDVTMDEALFISLVNNAISIQTHTDNTIRVYFSSPITGNYVVPTVELSNGRIEITEPLANFNINNNDRQGVLFVYLPLNAAAFRTMDLSTINGAVRIVGNNHDIADFINITMTNGIVELRYFNAPDIIVRTTNGTISANGLDVGDLEMRTTNGIVTLRDSQVSGDLTARTMNGGITLNNVSVDMDRTDLNAVNGIVTVR